MTAIHTHPTQSPLSLSRALYPQILYTFYIAHSLSDIRLQLDSHTPLDFTSRLMRWCFECVL